MEVGQWTSLAAEVDPRAKPGAPAAVENKTFRPLFSGDPDLDRSLGRRADGNFIFLCRS